MGDDLFDMLGSPPAPEEEEEQPSRDQATAGDFSAMLGDNDDDLDYPSAPPPQTESQLPSGPPSALIEWRRVKDLELRDKDSSDADREAQLREEAQGKLRKFHDGIQEASQKKAQHNAELDNQKISSLTDDSLNPWERIVAIIDINRPGSQTKDVSGFKKLLIQLKTKPPIKG
jgi:hypothetical protein